ncbi:hypothetical protein [Companilactobacillus sp.]|jgi:uncharacterized membrane protein|uniref:hypothetical protein n=1 Tax=Companilactobacillus sp. TaxID=2767905 RepID=UPI0025C10750|nr:hypothetical protein [Companilactobacillus sp.]MCH4008132.1 hypothetical protein [Companilactobacillus sp.]MCH4051689.1 hypothetical protein [Companilactobacillus sp.]MCH4076075.1 hypothetical protein [Companilactobacillus sp.]MCH4124650.1 hypothetical protein [Companilactobacillus sp.]MCH4132387.1 hypothetical protein [Companilactobacillus sp.]
MNNNNTSHIGFLELLTLIFVVAKLLSFITWSWWLAFLPIILKVVLSLIVGFIDGIANVDE